MIRWCKRHEERLPSDQDGHRSFKPIARTMGNARHRLMLSFYGAAVRWEREPAWQERLEPVLTSVS